MKLSEFNAKMKELFGDEDVEIYLDTKHDSISPRFNIFIDDEGDAVIEL